MKLLKGKRMGADLDAGFSVSILERVLPRVQASIGSGGRTKTLGMWLPSGSVIARRAMRPPGTEDRALCKDAGVMASCGPS